MAIDRYCYYRRPDEHLMNIERKEPAAVQLIVQIYVYLKESVMSFGQVPPEIIFSRLFCGCGSASMTQAAMSGMNYSDPAPGRGRQLPGRGQLR